MSGKVHESKPWRFLLAVAIFVIAGPPVGGLVAWLGMGAFSLRSPLPFIVGSYSEGIWLALGTGLIVAGAGLWLNMSSWAVPIVAALAINAIFFVLTAGMDFSQADYPGILLRIGQAFLLPSFAAAFVCWLLTRRLLQDADNSGA